jgi:hypothetical protein
LSLSNTHPQRFLVSESYILNGGGNQWGLNTATDTIYGAANDNAAHVSNGVMNGTSTVFNVDGTEYGRNLTENVTVADKICLLTNGYGSPSFVGFSWRVEFLPSASR